MTPEVQGPDGDAAPEKSSSRVGERLASKYELVRKLGEGGMGEVYEALHLTLGRRVAIKLLHPELARSQRMLRRFSREALTAGRLENDHIVSVADCGHTDEGVPYFVMEFLRGRDLRHVLREQTRLPVPRAVKLAIDVCRGLRTAHDQGLVHRDLKPENLFVVDRDDGRELAKILDFGVVLGEADTINQSGRLVGTARYMAPEQISAEGRVDGRVDIYALAVVLYECLTGQVPHTSANLREILFNIMNNPPRPIAELREGLPDGLVRAIERGLARDPKERFPSAVDFGQALIPFAGEAVQPLCSAPPLRTIAVEAGVEHPTQDFESPATQIIHQAKRTSPLVREEKGIFRTLRRSSLPFALGIFIAGVPAAAYVMIRERLVTHSSLEIQGEMNRKRVVGPPMPANSTTGTTPERQLPTVERRVEELSSAVPRSVAPAGQPSIDRLKRPPGRPPSIRHVSVPEQNAQPRSSASIFDEQSPYVGAAGAEKQ